MRFCEGDRELLRVAWKQSLGDLIGGDLPFLPEHHHGEDYEGHNRRHGGNQLSVTGVQIPSSLKLGQSKTISGVQRAYWASPMMSAREYMRTVSFASHEYVFQLLLVCTEKDASAANASFEQLLSELKLASSAKSGSAPKKKN